MESKSFLLTIGIPNYNYGQYLKKTIENLLRQKTDLIEIIISDNCSTDNSWEIINSYSAPDYNVFKQKENLGMINNWNFLLGQAKGTFFFLLPADDIVNHDLIALLINRLTIVNISEYSTLIWGYKNHFSSETHLDMVLPSDYSISESFLPSEKPDDLFYTMHFSAPWCHIQKTALMREAGAYPINSRRPDSRLYLNVINKYNSFKILSINKYLSGQRIHDKNERKNSNKDIVVIDNLILDRMLLNYSLQKTRKAQIRSYSNDLSSSFEQLVRNLFNQKQNRILKHLMDNNILSLSIFMFVVNIPNRIFVILKNIFGGKHKTL